MKVSSVPLLRQIPRFILNYTLNSEVALPLRHRGERSAERRTRTKKQEKNGQNLPGRGARTAGGEDDGRPVQHGGADEEHDGAAAEGEDSAEASRERR